MTKTLLLNIKGPKGDKGDPPNSTDLAPILTQDGAAKTVLAALFGPGGTAGNIGDRSPLKVSNAFGAWWSEPASMCHQDYDLTFAQGATTAGEFAYLTFDAPGHTARRAIAKTLSRRDDHNAGAVLIYPDRPALAAFSGHDTESAVYTRKGPGLNGVSGDGSVDSLGAETVVGTIPNGESTTYAALTRKPGSSVVLLMTRVGGEHWRWTYSTNSGDSWQSWASARLLDFTGITSKGYAVVYSDVAAMKAHVYFYSNPSQGTPGAQSIYYLVIDWATEKWVKPSTGAVVADLRAPSAPIVILTAADNIYTTPSGRRVRLGKPSKQLGGIDIPITEFAAAGGAITAAELVILEQTGAATWARRPLSIDPGLPFGGVGNAPYFAGFALPDPGHVGKKVAFIGRNFVLDGQRVHVIEKLAVVSSWTQTRTVEEIARSSRPLVRPMCPVNAGSIDVIWTEAVRYGNGYGDADADLNFYGIMCAHYRNVAEPWPLMIQPPNLPPVAGFTWSANLLAVQFTDASSDSDGTVASRAWNFGDGTTSTATSPSKTYSTPGTYTVTLTVTDNSGVSASTQQTLSVTNVYSTQFSDVSNAETAPATSLTWAHTNAAGVTDMVVFVAHNNAGAAQEVPSSVTYDGVAMTLVDSVVAGAGNAAGRLGSVWKLHNPTADGTAKNVVATKTTSARLIGTALSFKTSSSVGTPVKDPSDTGRSGTGVTITTPATALVVFFTVRDGIGTVTGRTGSTQRSTKGSSSTIQANAFTWQGGSNVAVGADVATTPLFAGIAVPILAAT